MKLAKQNKNLLEQIIIQKKIIEELNYKINLLEEEVKLLKQKQNQNNNNNKIKEKENACVEICAKCGKLFLFTSATDCCI
jgi:hypothetical protein